MFLIYENHIFNVDKIRTIKKVDRSGPSIHIIFYDAPDSEDLYILDFNTEAERNTHFNDICNQIEPDTKRINFKGIEVY